MIISKFRSIGIIPIILLSLNLNAQNLKLLNEWSFGGDENDNPNSVVSTLDGNYIVSGYSRSESISGNKTVENYGPSDLWFVKFDSLGNILWQKTFCGNNIEQVCRIVPTDHSYYVATQSSSGNSGLKGDSSRGGIDLWIFEINQLGSIIWQKTIGGNQNDRIRDIYLNSNGNLIVLSVSSSPQETP